MGIISAELPLADHVWTMRPEYTAVPIKNFKANLKNLRVLFSRYKDDAAAGAVALAHDRQLNPINPNPPNRAHLRWDGSTAQTCLKEDISNKLHVGLEPQAFRETRVEYKTFPLEVFRKHVQQELRSVRESSYWLSRPKRTNKQHHWA